MINQKINTNPFVVKGFYFDRIQSAHYSPGIEIL